MSETEKAQAYSPERTHYENGATGPKKGFGGRFIDSFRRMEGASVTPPGVVGADGKVFDAENAALATANSPLSRKLKGRHLQMIAIGGSIGKSSAVFSLYICLLGAGRAI
jgi:yeast amino acid transporter